MLTTPRSSTVDKHHSKERRAMIKPNDR